MSNQTKISRFKLSIIRPDSWQDISRTSMIKALVDSLWSLIGKVGQQNLMYLIQKTSTSVDQVFLIKETIVVYDIILCIDGLEQSKCKGKWEGELSENVV